MEVANKKLAYFYHLSDEKLLKLLFDLPADADDSLVEKVNKAIEMKENVRTRQSTIESQIDKLQEEVQTADTKNKQQLKKEIKALKFDNDLVESWELYACGFLSKSE